MVLWNVIHTSSFEVPIEEEECPKILAFQTSSKTPILNNLPTIAKTPNKTPKSASLYQRIRPLIFSLKFPAHKTTKIEYNVVEHLKKLKANISVMDLCRIDKKKLLLQALNEDNNLMKNPNPRSSLGTRNHGEFRKPNMNIMMADKNPRSCVPLFLLTFEVYNKNLHNYLVESSASSNVMPLLVCKKLNCTPTKSDTHIIQLDIFEVKVIGELKDVII
jgi:hypothetical protein